MKVVIIDDEKGIVEGLKKIISRYLPECKVVGEAYNGLDGFEMIQKLLPDIAITDIRMPKADGLDMIKMLEETKVQTKFILLSGYADFEYARRGMKLGVQFYINKPVEEEELRDSVNQVIERIRADRIKLQGLDELKHAMNSRIQEETLRDILDIGNDQTSLVDELLRSAQIPTAGIWFNSILIEIDGSTDALKELGFQPLFHLIDQALKNYCQVYRFRYFGPQIAIVIAHNSNILHGRLLHVIQEMKQAVYRELNLSISVGIGTVYKRTTGICQSFEEARNALSYKVIKGGKSVISFTEIMKITDRSHAVPEEAITRLEDALDNMHEEECVAIIREIFRGMTAEPGMNPADLQQWCLTILLSSIRKLSFQQLQQNDLVGGPILSLEGISRFRTLEYLEEWMIHVIRGIIRFKVEHNLAQKKDIISEIKLYVSKHYNEQISLADLAARFFISPYYLSQLFKRKTGDNYLNFLTQIRIDKAKELLENTDLKVYEICQMVGYSDAQHFARMFEKFTGCKPRDFRKKLPNV
ncbi:AraC family transcriptional regulator [Paenibacillus sp. FSL H7-0357]|uniref:helix-turn-helix domain-containing protein n=1 Tax=Paenibacillus sp. FSL H7-0357 TaxID=1536774 RepID=UPI0004F8E662|nr:helix-turn-helix domain-containing protein [Paenibacillus sp. FSL H7-0357]AIQ16642.1 AraC family transcriptional regulator [Paenibacillus sp. FSL H7-0357]